MKKIFFVAGILFTTTTVTFAHNTLTRTDRKETRIERKKTRKELRREREAENRNEVSILTKIQFAADFPHAENVSFAKTENYDEVSFISDKKNLTAYYDYRSNLVGTTRNVTFADLPERGQKEILEKYGDYTITGVIKYDDNEDNDTDMILYGTSFDDADNYFVELKKDDEAIVVKIDLAGYASYFSEMK